jgi:hypothetical protein
MIESADGRIITPRPVYAAADPTRPPTSACVAEIGMPKCVEKYTHRTATNTPMTITKGVRYIGSTIPFPIVLATAVVNKRGPIKLKNAAIVTALIGVRTRVVTTVAIEFVASFIPLTKLKRRARIIPTRMMKSMMITSA